MGDPVVDLQSKRENSLDSVWYEELVCTAFLVSICSFHGSADEGVCEMPLYGGPLAAVRDVRLLLAMCCLVAWAGR